MIIFEAIIFIVEIFRKFQMCLYVMTKLYACHNSIIETDNYVMSDKKSSLIFYHSAVTDFLFFYFLASPLCKTRKCTFIWFSEVKNAA